MVEETIVESLDYWLEQQDYEALEQDFKTSWASSGYDTEKLEFMDKYETEFMDYVYGLYIESLNLRE